MIRWTGLAPWEFEFPITYQSLQVGAWSGVAASAGEAVEELLPFLPNDASGNPSSLLLISSLELSDTQVYEP